MFQTCFTVISTPALSFFYQKYFFGFPHSSNPVRKCTQRLGALSRTLPRRTCRHGTLLRRKAKVQSHTVPKKSQMWLSYCMNHTESKFFDLSFVAVILSKMDQHIVVLVLVPWRDHMIDSLQDGDKETRIGAISAKVTPWLQRTMQGFGSGLRRVESERMVGWCNYVTAGVLSAGRLEFTVNTITQLCHANPRTFLAVVLLPNRSGDLRTPTKHLVADFSTCCFVKCDTALHESSPCLLLNELTFHIGRQEKKEEDDDQEDKDPGEIVTS